MKCEKCGDNPYGVGVVHFVTFSDGSRFVICEPCWTRGFTLTVTLREVGR